MPDDSFFENCVFISVDIQPSKKHHMTMESMPKGWRDRGFKLEDVNAALDFLHDVAIPNAVKTADACRQLKMPMIFVHWGYQFKDGMDLDPETRKGFLQNHGTNYEKWPHYIGHQSSSPHEGFKVRPDEYVIAKTAQDAFPSSNIDYVLRNLGVKNVVFVGGHTGACLGKTSKSAKERGYRTLCIRDATWDARESTRIPNMKECNYDYIVSTAEFLKLAAKSANKEIKPAAKEPDSTVQENIKPAKRESTSKEKIARKLDGSFFENCVFVSVDHQPNKRHKFTEKNMPGFYREIGASVADLNAAVDYLFDVAKPNAVNVADACRSINLPMVFIHWGYQFHDAMDLDPETRDHFLKHFGTDFDKWPHHISRSDSKPYQGFKVRKGEYVIAKTAQNAFGSSNIDYVLRNLGAKNIVFVGGHTGGCLGRTSKSAKQRGYRTLCVKDATFDARESTRVPSMEACNYDYIVSADEFIKLVDEYSRQ
ncbi:MAG: isochorismatase family protein [Planctomycetota bacterium]|nr:MAG: isochorismatase family protein [Planctomycetota bacterium]